MVITRFYQDLASHVRNLGGYHNAHLHLDRSHTHSPHSDDSHLSLMKKHSLISDLHNSPHYAPKALAHRINQSLDAMIACGTRRADSVIDVTADGLGLRALEQTGTIAQARTSDIDFRRAVYSPLGFRDDEPERWSLFEQGVALADLVGCLPERDDQTDYPDHIGYEECCRRMLDLGRQNKLELQVHVDQTNHPNENGTERLLDVIESERLGYGSAGSPKIWAVHMISPSTYSDDRWNALVDRLKAAHVGVICCPSAALGMRQLRGVMTPMGNSIARVLDLCAAGVPVRLGSDNLADMLSPSTTEDLTSEVFVLSAALRFYDTAILAKIACGTPLSGADRATLKGHIDENTLETAKAIRRWGTIPTA